MKATFIIPLDYEFLSDLIGYYLTYLNFPLFDLFFLQYILNTGLQIIKKSGRKPVVGLGLKHGD